MKRLLVAFFAAFGGGLLVQRIAKSRDHPVWRPRTELAVKHSPKGATAGSFWERRPVQAMVFYTDLGGVLCLLLALLLSTRPEEPRALPLPLLVLVLSSTILRRGEDN